MLGLALSETQGPASAPDDSKSQAAKYVTGLDIGREIFNNVNDALVFALPGGAQAADRGSPRAPVPDAGIVLLVKDPSKSKALLGEILRILELSTKCEPSEAFQVAAETRAFLSSRGIDLQSEQQTKTRTALEYFSKQLGNGDAPKRRTAKKKAPS